MRLPKQLIDLSRLSEINLSGRGGKEAEISVLLPLWTRVGASLYDYEIEQEGRTIRLEVKKQADLQWFDSGKYHRLSEADRDIRVMFIMHKNGDIARIIVARLGELIDWLCEHRSADGWTQEVMKIGADFKVRYPTLQFKAKARIASIYREAAQMFDVIYEGQA